MCRRPGENKGLITKQALFVIPALKMGIFWESNYVVAPKASWVVSTCIPVSWVEKAKAGSPHLSKKRLAIGLAWPRWHNLTKHTNIS